jgi:hypothetical protein
MSEAGPFRFTIVPDDYHVPYAGTAGDGRRFFLSEELFTWGTPDTEASAFVGLFLWTPDGAFDEVKVDAVKRSEGLPPGQAWPADAGGIVQRRLAELGDYVLEPIDVAPFSAEIGGIRFGFIYESEIDSIHIEPGDFIAYYEPWDGLEYDT